MRDKFLAQIQRTNKHPLLFRNIIGKLRAEISKSSYPALQDKVLRFSKHAKRVLLHRRDNFWGALRLSLILDYVPLEKEICWQVNQLRRFIAPLNNHLATLVELNNAVNISDYESARRILASHRLEHGVSLWNLEAEIACASREKDAEGRLDQILAEITNELPGSLTGLAAYQFADLYDQETTLGGFRSRVERVYKNSSYPLTFYIKTKFLSEDQSPEALSWFLNIESGFSYIDCYNALLLVLEASTLLHGAIELMPQLIGELSPICGIRDERLRRFLEAGGFGIARDGDENIVDSKVFPNLHTMASNYLGPNDSNSIRVPSTSIEEALGENLSLLGSRDADLYETYRSLQTTISKHGFLPWTTAMAASIDGLFFVLGDRHDYLQYCGACLPDSGPDDQTFKKDLPSVADWFIARGIAVHPWATVCRAIDATPVRVGEALRLLNEGQPDEALSALEGGQSNSITEFGVASIKIAALMRRGEEAAALSACVREALLQESRAGFLPFSDLVGNAKSFADLAHLDTVDLTIGLYFCLQHIQNSKPQFYLEYACKALLQEHGCSTLASLAERFPKDDRRIHFILWKVFTSTNLRLVRFLKSADEFDEARLEIFRMLLDLMKDDVQVILEEIRSLLRRRELRHAEDDVESTRITVSKEGLRRWAEEKHREQFNRIKKGRVTRIAPTLHEVEESLRQVLASPGGATHDSSIKTNLQDPLFAIGSAIFSECFTRPDDGLDHFISLRIRHGSLVGYLRAPLERASLVEQGTLDIESRLAQEWRDRLRRSSPNSVDSVINALGMLQVNFDSMVEEFRAELLQVKTEKKPMGMFLMGHPKVVWDAFHVEWEEATTFDSFFESVWTAFRSRLELDLEAVRRHIDDAILLNAEAMFRELHKAVDAAYLDPIDRAVIISAINDGTRWLQESVDVVKRWFVFNEEPFETSSLDFTQILDVALNVFKNARPSLTVTFIQKRIPVDIHFVRMLVPRLTDAFFIMLDNVFWHSGLSGAAKIELVADWTSLTETMGCLSVTMTNCLGSTVDIGMTKERLAQIREQIVTGQTTAALTGEGRSGLIKLAKIARGNEQDDTAETVSFDCSDDGRFKVTAHLHLDYNERQPEK